MNTELNYFLQTTSNGISLGSMYSMIAVGYSMVYSLLYQVNFAHGDLYVFGTFIAFSFINMALPLPLAILAAGLLTALIGMTIERTVYRPVRYANRIVPMISALGAALVLRTIAQVIWGPEPIAFPQFLPAGSFDVGGFKLFQKNIVVLAFATVLVLALSWFMKHTKFGRAIQATRDDSIGARSVGVKTDMYKILAFVIGTTLAGFAGALYASYIGYISPNNFVYDTSLTIMQMCIIGGLGSMPGSIIGAVFFVVMPEIIRPLAVYRVGVGGIIMIAFMLFRPQGILGSRAFACDTGIQEKIKQKRIERKMKKQQAAVNKGEV